MSLRKQNRLVESNSPYCLQHADNPVNWHPWGPEAFERAAEEDKPLFISIGYSTCHWCHVMARESFEDEEAADLLSRATVPVKVDREERPDVDAYYMEASLILNGSGGWPLTVFAAPDGKPFLVTTYLPKYGRGGSVGLMELIPEIERLWREERSRVLDSAESITAALRERSSGGVKGTEKASATQSKAEEGGITGIPLSPADGGTGIDVKEMSRRAEQQLVSSFDRDYGGFGGSPKFPQPHLLRFLLLRGAADNGGVGGYEMVEQSLRAMRAGGIYDHIGFGFHRYAVDRSWRVPHFEKMLYDQALLADLYLEVFEATGDSRYGTAAREVLTFALRELRAPEGGFYSALDAESEGEEGRFYLWDYDEFRTLLPDGREEWADLFNLTPEGNWSDPVSGERQRSNILFTAPERQRPEPADEWEQVRARLFAAREKRPRPAMDDKILADWNGLMLAALARAARVLGERELLDAAESTAAFLLDAMRGPEGRLLHSFRAGRAAVEGTLDDYAFLIRGLLALYGADFDPKRLQQARETADRALELFEDRQNGGFSFTAAADAPAADSSDSPEELIRQSGKRVFDAAIPSGYGVMTENLLRLFRLTGETEYRDSAFRAAAAAKDDLERAPRGAVSLLSALQLQSGGWEIVVVGDGEEARRMMAAIKRRYLPRSVILRKTSENAEALAAAAPYTARMTADGGEDNQAAAYLCRGFTCRKPVHTAGELARVLEDG